MADSLGSLYVKLAADIADFKAGLDKAQYQAQQFKRNVGRALGGIGLTISVAGFATVIKSAIDSADRLRDLSQQTGVNVKDLADLSYAAKLSGTDIESVSANLSKLNTSLYAAATGNKDLARSFERLGVDVKGVRAGTVDTGEAFKQLAIGASKITNDVERSALQTAVMGKRAKELTPLLNDNADGFAQVAKEANAYSNLIRDISVNSDEFNDNIERLKTGLTALALAAAKGLLPALNDITGAFIGIQKERQGTTSFFSILGEVMRQAAIGTASLKFVFDELSIAVSSFFKTAAALPKFFAGDKKILPSIDKDALNEYSKTEDAYFKFIERVNKNSILFGGNFAEAVTRPPRSKGAITGGGGSGVDRLKKELEANLKAIDRLIENEKDILQRRNDLLDLYNQENLLSFEDYYQNKNNIVQENLQKTAGLYAQEINALQKFAAKAKPADRIEAQGKINDLIDKERKLREDVSYGIIRQNFEQARALRDYQNQLQETNTQLLEFKGNLEEAAAIRFDIANESFAARLKAEGNTVGLRNLEILRQQVKAQAAFNAEQEKASVLLDRISTAESLIEANQRIGAISELEALRQTGEARQKQIQQLEGIAYQMQSIADASGNQRLIQNAQNFSAQIEILAKNADTLKLKFTEIFESGFTDFFTDVIDGTKSISSAFKDMANSITREINRLVAQDIARRILGGSGGGSGGGSSFISTAIGALAGLFGGGSSAGASSFGQSVDPTFGLASLGIPSFAVGTNFVPRDMLAMVHQGEAIIPAGENNDRGSITVINNFTINGQTDKRSQDQIAATVALSLQRAARRNT